jgi:hypothetical protein
MPTAKRVAKIREAAARIEALLAAADRATAADPECANQATRDAWDAVENVGATIHRQSRILSGKPRGG